MTVASNFWEEKSLDELTKAEWESLCDGCGKCCLHKLEDEDSGDILFTDVACKYLSAMTCQCTSYPDRQDKVPDCISLTPGNIDRFPWLPQSCAYVLVSRGFPLPQWHHLVSGTRETIHSYGMSVREKIISESLIDEDDFEDRIVHWV